MAEDLRVKLGKSQIESQNQGDPLARWPPEVWIAAIESYHAGTRPPPPRLSVVISSDSGPVDSPEKLQKLADLSSVPEVIETNEAHKSPESIGDPVRVSQIAYTEFKRLKDRAELKQILVWLPHWRTKKSEIRNAYIVTSVKEKNTMPGDA
ncbi:hypothetical protein F4825DRAFT_439059 [Nemania diffusa]|nr:hypothetical protein F4825DRAFT_439059 [Nemania diffusa]